MRAALAQLRRGEPIVIDGACGSGVASRVLVDTKRKLAEGAMDVETPADPRLPSAVRSAVARMPSLLDSTRLIAYHRSPPTRYPALAFAVHTLQTLLSALGEAELRLEESMSPSWPRTGLVADPTGSLLSVVGFNGTRYALHTDANARLGRRRKLTAVYYPRFEPSWREGDGGQLRLLQANGSERLLAPLADRVAQRVEQAGLRASMPAQDEPGSGLRP